MYKLLQILLCLSLFFSCTGKSNKKSIDKCSNQSSSLTKSVEKYDVKSLVSFKSEFVMEDGSEADGYYENRNSFISPYKSYLYNKDTLFVSTLHEVNSCAETVGRIHYSYDSLYLHVEQIGEIACTSTEFRKYYYVIVKENIKKYIIVF